MDGESWWSLPCRIYSQCVTKASAGISPEMLAVQVVRSQLVRKVGVVCHQHGLVVAAWTCVDEDTEVVFRGGRTGSCD